MYHSTEHNRAGGSRAMARATSITIYGIKACDTMKEARACSMTTTSLMNSTTTRQPASSAATRDLGARGRWETLLNRAGTTFRKLPEEQKDGSPRRRRSR